MTGLRPWGALVAIALWVLFELVVARGDWFWALPEASDSGVFYAVEQRVIRAHDAPEVVALGSSRMRDAVVPSAVAGALGIAPERVLNVAMSAGSSVDARGLYERNREWFAATGVVVIGVDEWFFTGALPPLERELRVLAPGDAVAVGDGAAASAELLSQTLVHSLIARIRLRSLLLAPWSLARSLEVDDERRIAWRTEAIETGPPAIDVDEPLASFWGAAARGAYRADALTDVIRLARADGLTVVLAQVPWRAQYADAAAERHPDWWLAYHEWLAHLADGDPGVHLVGVDRGTDIGIADEDFVDYGHLTPRGARVYSTWLGQQLRDLVRAR